MRRRRSLEGKIRDLEGEMVECGRRCGRAAVAEAGSACVQLTLRPSRRTTHAEPKAKWGAILEEAKRKPTPRSIERTNNCHERPQHSSHSLELILKDFKHKLKHLDDEQLAHVAFDLDKSVARVSGEAVPKPKNAPRATWGGCSCSSTEVAPPPPKPPPKPTSKPPSKLPQMVPLEEYLKVQEKLENGLSGFEEKFKRLESSRTRLKDENIRLLRELNEKTNKLERTCSKEMELQSALADSDIKVKSLSVKLDQFTLSMQEMSSLLGKVKEDNKKLFLLKGENESLQSCLDNEKEEREKLLSDYQNLLVEREKDKALLKIKDQEIASLKNNIQSITELIANNVLSNTAKSECRIPLDESELNLSSSTLKSNDDQSLVASSPSHKTPEPYTSWRRLSGIPPLNAAGDSPRKRKVKRKKGERKKPEEREVAKEEGMKEPSMGRLKRELKGIFAAMREGAHAEVDGATHPTSLLTDDGSFNPSGLSSWSDGTLLSLESSPSSPLTEEEVCLFERPPPPLFY